MEYFLWLGNSKYNVSIFFLLKQSIKISHGIWPSQYSKNVTASISGDTCFSIHILRVHTLSEITMEQRLCHCDFGDKNFFSQKLKGFSRLNVKGFLETNTFTLFCIFLQQSRNLDYYIILWYNEYCLPLYVLSHVIVLRKYRH